MQVGVLGPVQFDGGDSIRPRTRKVLSVLALTVGEEVKADRVADALWGESPPASWSKQVQICIWDLRRHLGPELVQTGGGGYRLTRRLVETDAERFEQLANEAQDLVATGTPERAATALERALELWRGPAYEELASWPPGRIEIERLDELRRVAEETLIEAKLASGEHRAAAAAAATLAAKEPLRERRWWLLALAHYRTGNQAAALRALGQARRVLVDELGIDPGPELVELEAAILQQDKSLTGPGAKSSSAHCPFKGLVPFEAEDADLFFGRDAEIRACLARLDTTGFLVVAGPSGCGKSSIVRAGVVPALRARNLDTVVIVPGSDAELAMSSALASTTPHAVLVVDQFEELFAGHHADDAISSFAERIARHAAERAPVIVTIRSDHLGRLGAQPALARLVETSLHLIGAPGAAALRKAIEQPAAAAGLRLEPGLTDLLISESEGEPGALPLLSHALAETWERRDGRLLTVTGYQATGGIRGAVARSAEQLYASLDVDQQRRLQSLMLRLVAWAPDGEPVRSHVDAHLLAGDRDRDRLVDLLVRARLVIAGDDTVELAHEAVARAWPRLGGWLEEDAEGRRQMRHLALASSEWESLGRPTTELYRGARLESALEWSDATTPDLTDVERAFLETSDEEAASQLRQLEAQARRQVVQNRRLRSALAGAALLIVLALVAASVAVGQRSDAQRSQREAALSALVANASSLRNSRRDLAALLAVEAHRLDPGPASESALLGTFTAAPGLERTIRTGVSLSTSVGTADYLGGDRTLLFGDPYGAVLLVDMESAATEALEPLSDVRGWPIVDASTDGRFVAAAWRPLYEPESGVVTVWDLETRTQRFEPIDIPFRIGVVTLDPDGETLAVAGGFDGRTMLFDARTGDPLAEVVSEPRPEDAMNRVVTVGLAFTDDGRLIVGSQSGAIRLVDGRTGDELARIDGQQETANAWITVESDAATIVTGGSRGIERFELATGQPVWPNPAPNQQCNASVVAARVGAVLCGEYSGRVIAFDLETGARLDSRFDSQQGDVCALVVSPDGRFLTEVTACQYDDVTLLEWRLDGGGPISQLVAETSGDRWIDGFTSEVGLIAAYANGDGEAPVLRRIDPTNGTELAQFPNVAGFIHLGETADAVAAFYDGTGSATVGRYDLDRLEPTGPAVDPGIEFDRGWSDGRLVIVKDQWGNEVRGIDLDAGGATGLAVSSVEGVGINGVAFADDPAATWFYAAAYDQTLDFDRWTIQRRDLATGEVLAESPHGYQSGAGAAGVVIAARIDGILNELDPMTLEPIGAPFPGTNGPVTSLGVDGAGRLLLVRAADDTVRLYDIATRTPIGDPIDTGTLWADAILRDDGRAAAAITRQGIVVWDLDPGRWVEAACDVAGRSLTREEWAQYIGNLAPYDPAC